MSVGSAFLISIKRRRKKSSTFTCMIRSANVHLFCNKPLHFRIVEWITKPTQKLKYRAHCTRDCGACVVSGCGNMQRRKDHMNGRTLHSLTKQIPQIVNMEIPWWKSVTFILSNAFKFMSHLLSPSNSLSTQMSIDYYRAYFKNCFYTNMHELILHIESIFKIWRTQKSTKCI